MLVHSSNQHGGKREGAGRKSIPSPLPVKTIRCTDTEHQLIKEYLKKLRSVEKCKLSN